MQLPYTLLPTETCRSHTETSGESQGYFFKLELFDGTPDPFMCLLWESFVTWHQSCRNVATAPVPQSELLGLFAGGVPPVSASVPCPPCCAWGHLSCGVVGSVRKGLCSHPTQQGQSCTLQQQRGAGREAGGACGAVPGTGLQPCVLCWNQSFAWANKVFPDTGSFLP